MLKSQLLNTPKQTHRYYLGGLKERYITISSEFDSGNLGDVKQISDFSYRITSACDCSGTAYEHNTRSWFYFSVRGFPPNTRGRFLVNKVNILWSFVNSKMGVGYGYHPVYDDGTGWKKLEEPGTVYENNNGEVEVMFDYLFREENQEVRFAITYPYELERCVKWVEGLQKEHQDSEEVYFQKEVIVKSPEDRDVYLLTITDKKTLPTKEREDRIEGLFPESDKERPWKDKKPVILISARVHPGQAPSSFALQGMINFLLNKDDLRSSLLRKFFTFKIVPMLNPDGVHNGNYRMDMFGQNLNRYYNTCTINKQPSIFALKSLMQHYSKDNRMMFYFDLHAHPARKGCFVYGNALSDFVHQVENYVFCKLMAMNTQYFQYQCCNFSKKHMKMKDRFEELTKQGCGRVFANKCSNMIHSFTLELGYHFTNSTHTICQPSNKQFKLNQLSYSPLLDCSNDPPQLTPKSFSVVGQSLLISILDLLQKNPYSRLPTTEYCTLDNLRRLIAFEVFHQDQRFRMFQVHTYTKVKHINDLIEETFYGRIQAKFVMQPEVEWPQCVRAGNKEKEDRGGSPVRADSGYKHSSSCLERVQLPDIRGSPNKIYKGRSYSVKKDDLERDQEKEEPSAMDSVESSDESETEVRKTEGNQRIAQLQGTSPDIQRPQPSTPKSKLRLLNLKLSLAHSPLQNMIRFSQSSANFPENNSCSSFNSSNRMVKQVNLTFQQNFIVLPNVVQRLSPIRQKQPKQQSQSQNQPYFSNTSPQKQQYSFLSQPSDISMLAGNLRQVQIEKMMEDEDQLSKQKRQQKTQKVGTTELQLREQLMREMQYFKKEIKEQFSKDIKKEVTEQINRNSFVRSYLKNKKNAECAKSRKNKFFPSSEKDILSVSSIKPQDRQKLLKLPSIGK